MTGDEKLDQYISKSIERIIKQCCGGDEAMSFLAIYSFIEGFFRIRYPEKLSFCAENIDISFPKLMNYVIKMECTSGSTSSKKRLYRLLKYYHGTTLIIPQMELNTGTDTNLIRHCFSSMEKNNLQVVVNQFLDFAEVNGFYKDYPELGKLNNLMRSKFSGISDSNENNLLIDSDGYPAPPNDLLFKIDDVLKLVDTKNRIDEELEELQTEFIKNDSIDFINSLIVRKTELKDELCNVRAKLSDNDCYIKYLDGLYRSIVEAQCRKNFESRIIKLSKEQINLIMNDIYRKSVDNPGRSLYLKGGPGTGKTLVLIASLLKLYKQNVGRTCLLTFYPTLNKYISYLFGLFNNSELLKNNLDIDKLDSFALSMLTEDGIMKFDDFLIPRIMKALYRKGIIEKKEVYSTKLNKDHLMQLFETVTNNSQTAKEIFRDVIEIILPNGIDTVEKFCVFNETNKQKWPTIQKALTALKDEEKILDTYLYYLFYTSDISDDAFSADHFDYILIDEAQDLTNAQIFAVNKFVSKSGGLILAGDPSQEIRNKRLVQWSELGVSFRQGPRYDMELVTNFRSSKQIQDLGNAYKNIDFLRINKHTKSVDGTITGPNPQLFVSDDTEETNYKESIQQIIQSVKMCVSGLGIIESNITIVSFSEKELFVIQKELMNELHIDSVLIHRNFQFEESDEKIRLCTLENIKGIDCPILLFLITDQTKEENSGNIPSILKANAIYTCITRAMYLLQIFIPKYCIKSDIAVAALINKLNPNDEDLDDYMAIQEAKSSNIIPLSWFPQKAEEPIGKYVQRVKNQLLNCCKKKYSDIDNIDIQIFSNLVDPPYAKVYAIKKVVENVENPNLEIKITEAIKENPGISVGDDFPEYILPSELESLIRKTENDSFEIGSDDPAAQVLIEVYNKFPERRENEKGEPFEFGFLNIAGCGLKKPFAYSTRNTSSSWPEYIKSMGNRFQYVKIPYENGLGYKFAFRPIEFAATEPTVTEPAAIWIPPEWKVFIQNNPHKFEPIYSSNGGRLIKSYKSIGVFSGTVQKEGNNYLLITIDGEVQIKAFYDKNPNYRDYSIGESIDFSIIFSDVKGKQLPSAVGLKHKKPH